PPSPMPTFECQTCKRPFAMSDATLQKFSPSWTPRQCRDCFSKSKGPGAAAGGRSRRGGARSPAQRAASAGSPRGAIEPMRTTAEVLRTYKGGPESGVFTDGAAHPNPGAGGWGAVFVEQNRIRAEV